MNTSAGTLYGIKSDNTVAQIGGGAGTAAWGGITGTLSAQTDLQSALDGKQVSGTYASGTGSASGTNTGDTARVSFTKPAGTAIADAGMVTINAVVRGPVGATGVVAGHFNLNHNLAATGHAQIPVVDVTTISAAFDITAPTNIGLCLTGGASDSVTIQLVQTEAWNI